MMPPLSILTEMQHPRIWVPIPPAFIVRHLDATKPKADNGCRVLSSICTATPYKFKDWKL